MAILTWRNVDAPNLSGSALAVAEASQGIGGAFNDLAAGLGQFGQAQTDRADAAAIQAASRITDSAAYAKALQEGSILPGAGIDPTRVSAKASQALADRQSTLLTNDFNNAQILNQQQDNELALKRFGLDEREFAAREANNQLKNQILQYDFGRTQLGNQRADQEYADQQAARDAAFQATQQGLTPAGAREYIASLGLSPRAQQMALGSLKLGGSLLNLPAAGSSGAVGRGADAVYGYGDYGSPIKPLSQGSFGEAYDFGQTLIPATKGKIGAFVTDENGNQVPAGTSAVGAYQFVGKTMEKYAKQVFGDNWREMPFTFENQSKIAEALFNDAKGGNLKAVWAGLPDATPGAYKNMTFEEFQREVLPRESGMTLDEIRSADLATRATTTLSAGEAILEGMQGNAAQRLGNIDLAKFNKDSENKDPDLSRAAEKAIKAYPALKGTDLNKVSNWLNQIVLASSNTGTPLTAAQATHVLGAAMRPDTGIFDIAPFNSADSGYIFDEDKMSQILQDVTSGGNLSRGIVQRQIGADVETYNAAAANVVAAQKTMEQIRQRDAQGLAVTAADREAATKALNKAIEKHEALNSRFSTPAYQQKLAQSAAEVADKENREQEQAALQFRPASARPVGSGPAQGIAYSPATAITTGLPNRAAELLQERIR